MTILATKYERSRAATPLATRTRPLAIVLHAFEAWGATRDAILLANALADKRTPVTIFALSNKGPLRSLINPAISVHEIPGQRARYAIPGLRRLIRKINPRVVFCSGPIPNLCCLAAVRLLPRVERPHLVLREVASPSPAAEHDPCRQERIAYRILRHCYRYADRIITLTEGARGDLMENFSIPASKIIAMRTNAVVTLQSAERIARWDGERGREPNLIVSIGRLSPEKNHRLLLQAIALLRSNLAWRLAVIGDGPQRAELEAFAQANGLSQRTTFVGYDPDPFAWMMRAQLAVCTSMYEGLCNAIIEALSCGTPVVSTDCPYGPREILQNGRYGTLVPIGDATALAAAIESALETPVDRRGLMIRGLNYTAERAAEDFLEIIADL
jgi:glycosyltransferase involved in cell wall biosynthesis